ncbi:hypothetical protein KPH14_012774 [Odynerus spinipes]|uniref:Uncharacterized protein n=1 Tax=Odynerus spinipes TaxID=1348599 RepID=A0AAD9RDN1_9HYME|nr:hypothetical protein KPH14_012774 [Odynerus spinipes]
MQTSETFNRRTRRAGSRVQALRLNRRLHKIRDFEPREAGAVVEPRKSPQQASAPLEVVPEPPREQAKPRIISIQYRAWKLIPRGAGSPVSKTREPPYIGDPRLKLAPWRLIEISNGRKVPPPISLVPGDPRRRTIVIL